MPAGDSPAKARGGPAGGDALGLRWGWDVRSHKENMAKGKPGRRAAGRSFPGCPQDCETMSTPLALGPPAAPGGGQHPQQLPPPGAT